MHSHGRPWEREKGEYDKAIEYHEKALKILNDVFPDGHSYIDIVKKNLKEVEREKTN